MADVDTLSIVIESNATSAEGAIEKLAASLGSLKSVSAPRSLVTYKNQIAGIADAAARLNDTNINRIRSLGGALNSLQNIQKASGLNSALNSLKRLGETDLSSLNSLSVEKVQSFTAALAPLGEVQKATGLNSALNALKKIPEITKQLDDTSLKEFATQMERVRTSIAPLANEMQKVSNGFAAFPIRIQKLISSERGLVAANNSAAASFGSVGKFSLASLGKLSLFGYSLTRIASYLGGAVSESNAYVENLNLFTVAMGDAADESLRYAETVKELVGIDPSEWIRNQGVFKQITSGFGVVESQANKMSKNLTQIGYDISSFFNISIEDAMQKVQSGIAGELEPLRRLGYALDIATLQQIAYAHGIDKSIYNMNQAEKSQLRYLAIMEQSENVMGDMARTVQTPANAMRILNQEITQLKRALGNVLIPTLQAVIPVVQAVVVVLTDMAQAIANLLGFELPTIDYSGMDGLASSTTEVEDSLGGATQAAKEFKRQLIGIDELTILSEPNDSGSGGGAGVAGGDWGLELPEYNFLEGLSERTDEWRQKVEDLIPVLTGVGAAFAAWKIAPAVSRWFNDLKAGKFNKAIGLAMSITGFSMIWDSAYDIGYNGLDIENGVKTAIGAALGIGGSLLVFGTGPLGWAIGIGATLAITIGRFAMGYNRKQLEEEIKNRFGEIELTIDEAREMAENMMSFPLAMQLDLYATSKTSANQAIEDYMNSSEGWQYKVWKASVGLEVSSDEIIASLDEAMADAQAALSNTQETWLLAINIGLEPGAVQSEMASFVAEYFSSAQEKLTELGKKLRSTIDEAMADGVIDADEYQTILNYQKEMNEMLEKIADAKYRAQIRNVVYELDDDLSYDSLMQVMEELKELVQQRLDEAEQAHIEAQTVIELAYEEDEINYDEYVAAINEETESYMRNKAVIEQQAFAPLIEKFTGAYQSELDLMQPVLSESLSGFITETFGVISDDETGMLVQGNITDFMAEYSRYFTGAIGEATRTLKPEERKALEELLEALNPTKEDLEKTAAEALSLGQAVPENVSKGLRDLNMLAALTGDLDAINYLMGDKLSTDPTYLEALGKAKDAGISLNENVAAGILNNLQIIEATDTTVTLMGDNMQKNILELSPDLKKTLEDLGVDITENGLKPAMSQGGTEAANAMIEGINKRLKSGQSLVQANIGSMIDYAVKNSKQGKNISMPTIGDQPVATITDITGYATGTPYAKRGWALVGEQGPELMYMRGGESVLNNRETMTLASQYSRSPVFAGGNYYSPGLERDDNEEVINAIYAAANQLIEAVNNKDNNTYLDGRKISMQTTSNQNRQNRMYGRTLQNV